MGALSNGRRVAACRRFAFRLLRLWAACGLLGKPKKLVPLLFTAFDVAFPRSAQRAPQGRRPT